jgi:6-phosphogluconolactonase
MKAILGKVVVLGLIAVSIVGCGGGGNGGSTPPATVYKYFAYVANETSNNIAAFTINSSTGALTAIGSPVATGSYPMSVAVDPKGKFAYVANETDNTVSVYAIDSSTGALTAITGSPFAAGEWPFSVAIDPSGEFAYVANMGDDTVSAYTIDSSTGALTEITGSPFIAGVAPVSVAVDPTSNFVYVACSGPWPAFDNTVYAYTINSSTGALTAITGSPFAAGTKPGSVATIRIKQ